MRHHDGDVRRHARLQPEVLIIDIDHDVIGHHILHIDRGKTDLTDRAGKLMAGISIDGKGRLFPFGDPADIRFANVRIDLHLRQIERDQEKVRCGETGGNRLTDLHGSRHDDPVHRRPDDGVLQVQLCGIQRRLCLFHLRPCHVDLGLGRLKIRRRHIHVVLRHVLLRHQRLHPIQLALALRQIGFGPRDIGFRHFKIAGRLIAAGFEGLWVDQSHDVAGLDHRIEVGMEALDHAGHLGPDLNRHDRIDRARRRHERHDGASLHHGAPIADRHFPLSIEKDITADGGSDGQHSDDQNSTTHQFVLQFPRLRELHCINRAEGNHLAATIPTTNRPSTTRWTACQTAHHAFD